MGEGFGVSLRAFPGHAVENFVSVGSASALCSSRSAQAHLCGSVVWPVCYQSKDWFQMAAPLPHSGPSRTARSISTSQTFAQPHTGSLAQVHFSTSPPTSLLGRQKDLCSPAPTTSPCPPAQSAHDHRLLETAWGDTTSPSLGSSRSSRAFCCFDRSQTAQRGLDSRLQRLVPHSRWAASRSFDSARPVQPFPLGHTPSVPSP